MREGKAIETVYILCFALGAIYAVMSVIFGDFFDAAVDSTTLPYVSPTTIGSFITVFGGSGLYLSNALGWSTLPTLTVSSIISILASSAMFFFIIVPMHKAQKSSAKSNRDMIGHLAEVITPIRGRSKGEIIYEQGGSTLSAPAATKDGSDIENGAIVRVIDVVSGTFVVEIEKNREG